MSTATIEVAFANPPKDGKKQGTIKTTEGEIYGVWPDKLALLRPGARYQIEFAERPFEGKTYRTIRKVTKCDAPQANTNGASNGHGHRVAAPPSITPAEHDFVTRMLAASIQANAVETTENSLLQAVRVLRGVYKKSML